NNKNFIQTATHIIHAHTQLAPFNYKQLLPSQFSNYKSLSHLDPLIHTNPYTTVHQSIKPLHLIQQLTNQPPQTHDSN
ncbi:hypothetical protein, partial [Staphylococcus epidermidis]|uniref:hypothetical protein n=1 Tax=Staphylococcus epidermidis TaxID=1282 RepID=UPI001C9315C9